MYLYRADAGRVVNRSRVAAVAVAVIGLALAGLYVLRWPGATTTTLYASLPFVWIGAALAYTGLWITRTDEYVAFGDVVLAWTLGGAVAFGAVAVLALVGRSAVDTAFGVPTPVIDTVTGGALAGALVGLYDARSRHRYDALQRERDRVDQFAHKAASLNHYGKALNQSRSIHEVGALGVEVLELLIGGDGAAVFTVAEDVDVLESTLPDRRTESLRPVARDIAAGDPMTTVRYPAEAADPSAPDVEPLVGVPIPTESAETLVLVATRGGGDVHRDEDLDLLESLSAHVGTALANVDAADRPAPGAD